MGKITNVLNKIQELRQSPQDQEISDFFHTKEAPQTNFKLVVITIIAVSLIAAFFISDKIYNLENSVKVQEKRINDLTILLINTKNLSDSQIQHFNFRLKDEADVRKIEINNL